MAAAVFRSAARGLLQRSSFRRALFANKEKMPRELAGPPTRLYSSDSLANAEPSTHPHLHLLETIGRSGKPMAVLPPKEMKPLKHTFLTVDEVERILDRHGDAVKELEYELRDLFEYNRRKRLLVRGFLLCGAAVYTMHHFFGHQEEDKEKTTAEKAAIKPTHILFSGH